MKLSKVLSCGPRGKQNNRINISSGKSIFNPTLVREKEGGDYLYIVYGSSLVAQMITSPLAMQETQVQSLGLEDPQEKENGNPLQYSCMENPMDRGAWQETRQSNTTSSSILTTFCRENASTTSRTMQKMLSKKLTPKAQIFMLQK